MLYYLSTMELEEKNDLFSLHMQKLKERIPTYLGDGLPGELQHDKMVINRLCSLAADIGAAMAGADAPIYNPKLICGMNETGIRWNTIVGIPNGKEIMIIDENDDAYDIDAFEELARGTCNLTATDEETIAELRASQDEPEADTWRAYLPDEKT